MLMQLGRRFARHGQSLNWLMAGMLVACAFGASDARADPVTEWNAIMEATVTAAPSNPVIQTRWGAIVQLAVFEAVNSITGEYEPYLGTIDAPESASIEAAAIVAAYDTLAELRPTVVAASGLEAVRDAGLAEIADGDAKEDGIAVGHAAAAAMLALRAADGSGAVVSYEAEPGPGVFQPLPGQSAFLPAWGWVTPFALADGSQFRLPPPPKLHSRKYADAYNEVKLLGRIDSPLRSQDRTDVARLYAAASPVQVFNSAARQVSDAQELTLSQNARLFAQLGMAMADAAIACWETKYHYDFWRPQAAIRAGDTDGNNRTQADPEWLPLIATPPHPSYASGHATVSGAAVAVLRRTFGKDGHAISISHPSLPGIVLNYSSWQQITDDIDDARIYGGNLTQDDTARTYVWDRDNMLSSTTKSGVTVSYAYDALGRRASRTGGGSTTVFVSDGQIVVAEYTSGTVASSPLRKYINASYVDEPVLLIDRTALGSTGAGTDERLYYHRNQQYSITALTNNAGTVVERYAYTAYGQPTILDAAGTTTRTSSAYGNAYMWTCRDYDTISSLHYSRTRYMHAALGRFMSRDPLEYIDGASLLAAYFVPSRTDPLGLGEVVHFLCDDGSVKEVPIEKAADFAKLRPDCKPGPNFPADPPPELVPLLPRNPKPCSSPPCSESECKDLVGDMLAACVLSCAGGCLATGPAWLKCYGVCAASCTITFAAARLACNLCELP